jgi:D-alanyl-D-alanine carboxypeptidase (penicillin-binding protein 5/6)
MSPESRTLAADLPCPLVSAEAWAMGDGETGELLCGQNEFAVRPIASITKLMTALVALTLADSALHDEPILISESAARIRGSSAKLRGGDCLAFNQMLHAMLLPSGNDAAQAIAEHFGQRLAPAPPSPANAVRQFVSAMNEHAQALGLQSTSFVDPHGKDSNQSHSRDLIRLGYAATKQPTIRAIVEQPTWRGMIREPNGHERGALWKNTNRLLGMQGFDGVKTGTTRAAGSCLLSSAKRGSDRLLCVVLGAPSSESCQRDTQTLMNWAWNRRVDESVDAKLG